MIAKKSARIVHDLLGPCLCRDTYLSHLGVIHFVNNFLCSKSYYNLSHDAVYLANCVYRSLCWCEDLVHISVVVGLNLTHDNMLYTGGKVSPQQVKVLKTQTITTDLVLKV